MGKVYKDKKGSSCGLCKPHKKGWTPKHKDKYRLTPDEIEEWEIMDAFAKISKDIYPPSKPFIL